MRVDTCGSSGDPDSDSHSEVGYVVQELGESVREPGPRVLLWQFQKQRARIEGK